MSEITKDFIKFVAEVIVLLLIVVVLFGEEGIASNTFYYLIYVEPILLQNWLASSLSIGSFAPGEFTASTETTGQAYTVMLYEEDGTNYVHVIPPEDYYLKAKFALIEPTAFASNCRIYNQEVKFTRGMRQTVTVKKTISPDGSCLLSIGAPTPEVEVDAYPHISFSVEPENPSSGETFVVKLKYTHDKNSNGAIHIHWPDSQADTITVTGCVDSNTGVMDNYEFIECGTKSNPMANDLEVTIEFNALADNIEFHYRAWDWSKDANCKGALFDYHRDPLGGICSENCDLFPDDTIVCETLKKTV